MPSLKQVLLTAGALLVIVTAANKLSESEKNAHKRNVLRNFETNFKTCSNMLASIVSKAEGVQD